MCIALESLLILIIYGIAENNSFNLMHHVKCIWDILRLMEDKCLLVFVVLLNLQTAHALSRNTFVF